MHPRIATLTLGEVSLPIASYGLLLTLALLVGSLGTLHAVTNARATKPLELGAVISALGIACAGGFAGALLLHALVQVARTGTWSAAFSQPGVSVLGGLLGGASAVMAVGPRLGLRPAVLLDASVPYVALAQAIGRLGCLLGGCCYGAVSKSALALPYAVHDGVRRLPVPLFESCALLALAWLFARPPAHLRDRLAALAWATAPGARALAYAAAYAVLRLALEPLRADAARGEYWGGAVSTGQLVALFVLIAVLISGLVRVRRARALVQGPARLRR